MRLRGRRIAITFSLTFCLHGAALTCGGRLELEPVPDADIDVKVFSPRDVRGEETYDAPREADVACPRECSPDLHLLLDCHGSPVAHCPGEQGCVGQECIDACAAAELVHSAAGCEHYAVPPPRAGSRDGSCYAAVLSNTWTTETAVVVEFEGQPLDVQSFARIASGYGASIRYHPLPSGKIPQGQVAILFLSHDDTNKDAIPCPPGITPAIVHRNVHPPATGRLPSFRILTTRPVVVHDYYPYGGATSGLTSASLLLARSTWETYYVMQSVATTVGKSFFQVQAAENDTKVVVHPNVGFDPDAGLPGNPGSSVEYRLDRDESLLIMPGKDMTGSVLVASKPVGLWGGATLFQLGAPWADTAHQQIAPLSAIGREYIAVRYRNRMNGVEEPALYRIVGVTNGTTLEYEGTKPYAAPTTLQQGERVDFLASGPFVVRSKDIGQPFFLFAYMSGGSAYDGRGDAEWVQLVPTTEYDDSYLFLTDPSYPETNLVITRKKVDGAYAHVTLDCAGELHDWQSIDAEGEYQYTRFDLVRRHAPQGACNNGAHSMKSPAPFGVMVWGWGGEDSPLTANVSYAFPAGMRVRWKMPGGE